MPNFSSLLLLITCPVIQQSFIGLNRSLQLFFFYKIYPISEFLRGLFSLSVLPVIQILFHDCNTQ